MTASLTYSFFVDGIPATKGSWKVGRRGKLRPDNERERPWANAVAWTTKAAGVKPIDGAIELTLWLFFPRPKRPTNPFPSRNDVDKLARSCMDALTGIAWADDQQVTDLFVQKRWQDDHGPGARFWIRESCGNFRKETPNG